MHFSLMTWGTRGDVQPFLALALGLKRQGHDVLILAPPDFKDDIRALGIDFEPYGVEVRIVVEEVARTGPTVRTAARVNAWVGRKVIGEADRLIERVRGTEVLVGAGVAVAAFNIAEVVGARYRFVGLCPQVLPSARHPHPMVRWHSLPGWANRATWAVVQPAYESTIKRSVNQWRRDMGLAPVRSVITRLADLDGRPVIAADEALAPIPKDVRVACVQTAAMQLPPLQNLSEEVRAFLDAGDPPVYVGFGSMPSHEADALTRAVLEGVRHTGRRALIQRGWAELGGGDLPDGCLLVGREPHARLFPRCSVAVHHGGAGTTTTAARAGVPQAVVPHWIDQYYWGHRVHALGIGADPIPRRRLDGPRLAEAIEEALEPDVIACARAMGKELAGHDGVAKTASELGTSL